MLSAVLRDISKLGLMNFPVGLTARQFPIALVAAGLVASSLGLAYRAGCAQSGAGSTVESLDLQFFAVWLMIPGLLLCAALFAMPASHSLLRAALRAALMLCIALPLAIVAFFTFESWGQTARHWCALSIPAPLTVRGMS